MIENLKKVVFYAIGSITFTTLLAALFSLLKASSPIQTIFNANYIIATVIIAVGTLGFFVPVNLMHLLKIKKSNRLVDHSNLVDVLKEEREIKISESLINICWGICHMILIGITEIIIKSIL